LTAQSGQPYSAMVNTDLNNDSNRSTDRTPGIGRDTFYLPRTISLDPRITKNVQFTEHFRLQLIAEAFNVFNHSNINGVSRTQYAFTSSAAICGIAAAPCLAAPQVVSSRPFLLPTADVTPRIAQLAAKFVF